MDILIVESAAKARTLGRYLGKGWKVLATGGHVQTLPNDRKLHGKDGKKAYWASAEGALPSPPWVWTDRGEKAVQAIIDAAGEDKATFWLAPDPDREGEFIAWRLEELLAPHGTTHRVTFHEVTADAVRAAVDAPRTVDMKMVESALVRKFLDRLVGFRTSKLARGMLRGGSASMGRVQTPALGFVVERELEREAHVPIPYFEVRATAAGIVFQVRFSERNAPDVWRDEADRAHPNRTHDRDAAQTALHHLTHAEQLTVLDAATRNRNLKPKPPFTTDALLQAGGSRFGWTPRKTSALASMLYEAGHITYIRTDSTRLADTAVAAARQVVEHTFGATYLGTGATAKSTGKGPVQDAHEAIRPTRLAVADVDDIDDDDARKLYRLVRAQVLASQMAPSIHRSVQLTAAASGLDRPLRGSVTWRTFAGHEAAMGEFQRPIAESPPEGLVLAKGQLLPMDPTTEESPNPELVEDATRPPSRYRAHTLVKAMKDAGIGRPSTYAKTVDKLEDRRYVADESGALVPTERGRAAWLLVAPLYAEDDSDVDLFSAEFTAAMEEQLDAVAQGEHAAGLAWTTWRDQIRSLHDLARARRKAGHVTPRTRDRLERLLSNTSDDTERPDGALTELSEADARTWIERLIASGIEPAPTPKQVEYAQRLMEELSMTEAQAADLVDRPNLEAVRTSAAMSSLIEQLKAMHDERRPPSRKQAALIERLLGKDTLTPAQAAALVEADDLESLTGGREGTASALIDILLERSGKGKKGASAKTAP